MKIEPKQDLHRYDKPWIGGTGKNLLPFFLVNGIKHNVNYSVMDNGTVVFNGTANSTATGDVYFHTKTGVATATELTALPAGNYKFSGISGGSTSSYRLYAAIYEDPIRYVGINDGIGEFTLSSATKVSLFLRLFAGTVFNNILVSPMIYAATESDIFEPYENICPIEGWDEVEVTRTGKNLVFDEMKNSSVGNAGEINELSRYSLYIAPVIAGRKYTITTDESSAVYGFWRSYPFTTRTYNNSRTISSNMTFTAPITGYIGFRSTINSTKAQLDNGTVATSYSAPQPMQQVQVSLSSVAGGTVYGGTVTVNEDGNGTLTVDKAAHICDGTEIVDESSTNGYMMIGTSHNAFMAKYNIPNNGAVGGPIPIVSHYKGRTYKQSSELNVGDSCTFYGVHQGSIGFYTIFDETTEFKQYLTEQYQAGTPVTFILPLTNP